MTLNKRTFARHETFHFREGWLTKGFRKVETENIKNVFLSNHAMEELGIGSNMVKSLRYWMQATRLTEESGKGKKEQNLTPFGQIVYKYDKYLENELTLWLIHYHLANNKELATTWYWFFNVFGHKEFDEEVFLKELESWVKEQGEEVSKGSFKKDFECLVGTYLSTKANTWLNPEDNMGCPLQELNLLEAIDTKRKRFRLTRRNILEVPKEVFYYAILDFTQRRGESSHIGLDSLLQDDGSIGRVFSLALGELIQVLEVLQDIGYLNVSRTAGLNDVSLKVIMDPIRFLDSTYESIVGSSINV
jgi:hypothetical protein